MAKKISEAKRKAVESEVRKDYPWGTDEEVKAITAIRLGERS